MKKIIFTFIINLLMVGTISAQSPKISIVSCTPDLVEVEKDIDITVTLKNEGDATENNMQVTLSSDNQYVTIIDGNAVFGPMANGATQEGSFVIKVNQMVPDNANLHFNLSATLEGSSVISKVSYDFEDGISGWTTIDADGDGFNWIESGPKLGPGYGHESQYCMFSQSYDNTFDVLYPDNYLVSPEKFKIAGDATLSFWACAQDKYYPYEHFGVAISTSDNSSADEFEMIAEWTLDSIAQKDQGEWGKYIVDLSEYEGQELWIAIRHFDCFDQYYMALDDVEINNVYQPLRLEERFFVTSSNPIPNIVFKSYQCDEITAGATVKLDVTMINDGGMATSYESKVILSSEDEYVTILEPETTIGSLEPNQTVTKTFTFSTKENMPEEHEITFNINIEPNDLYDENVDFTYQFEKDFNAWTTIDANNDGHTWYHNSDYDDHDVITVPSHSGHGHLMSESSCNALLMPLQPDDYLVTPNKIGIKENTKFSFWACAQDEDYIGEHFGVAVSAASNTSAKDFITIAEWDLGISATRFGDWINYSVDLGEFAGSYLWIAIRHFNCENIFIICVDDINISNFVRCHNWSSSFSIKNEVALAENHNYFNMYPNPVKDYLTIESNIDIKEINIYDVNGRLIYNENEKISNVIDMSDCNAGTYFVKIKSGEKESTLTFIKK